MPYAGTRHLCKPFATTKNEKSNSHIISFIPKIGSHEFTDKSGKTKL